MNISPWPRADNQLWTKFYGQQSLSLQSSVVNLRRSPFSLILCRTFHDFIHICSPEVGADILKGTKFWCQLLSCIESFKQIKSQLNALILSEGHILPFLTINGIYSDKVGKIWPVFYLRQELYDWHWLTWLSASFVKTQ